MARDLDTIENVLWTQFERAVQRQDNYEDCSAASGGTPSNFAIAGRTSIAALADALTNVMREKRVREFGEDLQKIHDQMETGTTRDVAVSPPLKIKS